VVLTSFEKVYYDENSEQVWINKGQYFEGISKVVWEYRIGAYQVLAKYLKDRKKARTILTRNRALYESGESD
jgi:hypothetical protein